MIRTTLRPALGRSRLLAGSGRALLVVLAASAAFAAGPIVISQKGKTFRPGSIDISAGDLVLIDNDDRVLHHVYVDSPDFQFDSGEQPPGRRVSIRFTERGTFEVACEIHPKMKLTVNVR